jgi:hypothetical protein
MNPPLEGRTMLDATSPIPVPGVPGVQVYADLDDPRRVHVVPLRPRLAPGRDGRPEVSLVVYRRRGSLAGGQLYATVELALDAAQEDAVHAALDQPDAPVTLAPPEWLAGHVTLAIAGRVASGQSSLIGANRCALAVTLDGAAAAALVRRWPGVAAEATVRYDVELQAGERGHAEAQANAGSRRIAVTATGPTPLYLTLTGPLAPDPTALADTLQIVDL